MLKVLNLYAGIGGNRRLWHNVEVTAIELDADIAHLYATLFPEDKVLITDAHEYLLQHYKEFDFIWSSPVCKTHSKMQLPLENKKYADLSLYQEIILLQNFSYRAKFVIENTVPYYTPLIKPSAIMQRHCFWSNFPITEFNQKHTTGLISRGTVADLEQEHNLSLDKFQIKNKREILRNCVNSDLGLHLLECAFPRIYKTNE